MTPKQSGETIVVAPTTLNPSTPAVSVLKKEEADANFEDSTLEKAERKMLNEINPEDDEEISSFDESGTPLVDTIKLENRMISVAIARSVADDEAARAAPPSDASNGQHTFRKRQRVDEESSMVPPVVKLEQIKPIVTPAQTVSVHQGQPPTVRGINQGFSQQGVSIKSGGSELTRRIASGPRVEAHKSATQPVMSRPRNATIVSKVTSSQQPLIRPLVRPTALKVPNPLANIPAALPIKPVKQESPRPPSVTNTTKSYSNRPPLVPCPLPPIPCPLPAPSSVQSSRVQPRPPVKSGTTISLRPPRTVPTQTTATPVPSMSVGPPLPQRRGRIFSIDIDCKCAVL